MKKPGNGYNRTIEFTRPPERVVSLVPSMTESLFDLGFGESVVGITDFCTHPKHALQGISRVGGPKNPDIDQIIQIEPDLVLVNQEENAKEGVEALQSAGLKVWITFPKTVRQSLDILWILVGIYQSKPAAARLETLELTLDWAKAASADHTRWRFFCPIWYQAETNSGLPEWWMTFNHQTYVHDLLHILGGENVFSDRARRYPLGADLGLDEPEMTGERDERYPRVTLGEIVESDPEVILLPSEPYPFDEKNLEHFLERFNETSAAKQKKVFTLDGSLLTWHGTRLARSLSELPSLLGDI
jgi:ABC-type Fe3+-hydroxamate transport system substrate-binding protein